VRRLLACAFVASLIAAPAQAYNPDRLADGSPRSHTSRVHNIRLIALAYWGDASKNCDHGTMDMPIVNVRGLSARTGHIAEFAHSIDDDPEHPPWHDCSIRLNKQPWTASYLCSELGGWACSTTGTEYLCRLIAGHELGHAARWRAPTDQAYVWPNGFVDTHHSRDPMSIMWPFTLAPFPPCADGAADTR
jgi:hypothetical protein